MSESMLEPNESKEKRRGRGMMLLLGAMFALPLLIVAAMYQFQWHPRGASHGLLISPPQPLQLEEMPTLQGNRFGAEQWKNKWSLVYVGRPGCDAACEAQLHDLRQVHATLGKEIERAQRILLITSDGKDENLARIQAQYPDLVILAGPVAERLAAQFGADSRQGSAWLVDPLGNLMMRYPPGYEARGMYQDLLRLMTYSWIG